MLVVFCVMIIIMENVISLILILLTVLNINLANKMHKSLLLTFGFGIIFPFLSTFVYLILFNEFKKTGKSEFKIM